MFDFYRITYSPPSRCSHIRVAHLSAPVVPSLGIHCQVGPTPQGRPAPDRGSALPRRWPTYGTHVPVSVFRSPMSCHCLVGSPRQGQLPQHCGSSFLSPHANNPELSPRTPPTLTASPQPPSPTTPGIRPIRPYPSRRPNPPVDNQVPPSGMSLV